MKKSFKTPALYNYLIYLTQIPALCKSKDIILSYLPKFSSVDLKEDAHITMRMSAEDHETYMLPINLDTNETINIFWDIDSIIEYIKTEKIKANKVEISEIFKFTYVSMNDPALLEVKQNQEKNIKIPHKLQEIILAQLSIFPKLAVLDGNHRLFEAMLAKKDCVDIILIPPEKTPNFLLPNSQKLIHLWLEMDRHITYNK